MTEEQKKNITDKVQDAINEANKINTLENVDFGYGLTRMVTMAFEALINELSGLI